MRLTIYKDSKGRIILANNISAPARDNPICVEKKNRKLRILRLLEHIYAEDLEPHLNKISSPLLFPLFLALETKRYTCKLVCGGRLILLSKSGTRQS